MCIDKFGELTPYGVDKFGVPEMEMGRLTGDTVYCLDELDVPVIVGVGDEAISAEELVSPAAPISWIPTSASLWMSSRHASRSNFSMNGSPT